MIAFGYFRRKTEYLDWETYKRQVDLLNIFSWQQHVRRKSLSNICMAEEAV
ncbi:hypothetical protein JXB31_00820 [Candidatus Woesearchaeota archaeon]|nr:hypothetical protein [Candidatus Woesearchaeota archaeon]